MKFASTAAVLLLCTSAAAHYCPPKCEEARDFSTASGRVDYPHTAHGHYKNQENHCWRLHCDGILTITWEKFDVEQDYDFVELHTLVNGQYNRIYRKDSQPALPRIDTVNGSALVRLESDYIVTDTGIDFHWTCSKPPPSSEHEDKQHFCGEDLAVRVDMTESSKGYIAYPASGCYPNNDRRCYEFVCPEGEVLTLDWNRMDLERGYDFLELWHVGLHGADRLEWKDDVPYTFPGGKWERDMLLRFSSDELISYTGFNVSYECAPPPAPTPVPAEEFVCPPLGTQDIRVEGKTYGVLGKDYKNNMHQCWNILCPKPGKVTLDFIHFQTEANFDFVWVYEYAEGQGTYTDKERYHGNVPTAGGVYDGSVVVRFKSDGGVTAHGFDFTFKCEYPPPQQIPM